MNEHSPKFERVKMWYDTMRWTKEMVANAVTAPTPWITETEYAEITGEQNVIEEKYNEVYAIA